MVFIPLAPFDSLKTFSFKETGDFHRYSKKNYYALLLGSFQIKIWEFLLELIHEIFQG